MNSTLKRLGMVAGVILSGTALAGSYVKDDFTGVDGASLSGQWQGTAFITNIVSRSAAAIPINTSLTNVVTALPSATNVWTEFVVRATPFQSAGATAPDLDLDATAQFFVQSNGCWALIYRDSSGLVTNTFGKNLYGGSITNSQATWTRVSVLHNYGNHTWSFFVEGQPVMTNGGFIANSPAVSVYERFTVQSLGGDPTNRTLLDDFLFTNAVPPALTADVAGGANSIRDAWDLMYYGALRSSQVASTVINGWTIGQLSLAGFDPNLAPGVTPVEYAFGTSGAAGITTVGRLNAALKPVSVAIATGDNVTNILLGSSSPNGPWTAITNFHTGVSGSAQVNDPTGTDHGSVYFYMVVGQNGTFVMTNETKSVFYKTDTSSQSRTNEYFVGVPINYGAGSNLNSTLGDQLASGLSSTATDPTDPSSTLTLYTPPAAATTYWLDSNGKWREGAGFADVSIPPGRGVRITRLPGPAWDGAGSMLLSGLSNTNAPEWQLGAGWNLVAWGTYDTSRVWSSEAVTLGTKSFDQAASDHVWVIRDGVYTHLRLYGDGTWRFMPNKATMPSNTVWGCKLPGEAVFYFSLSARNWTP